MTDEPLSHSTKFDVAPGEVSQLSPLVRRIVCDNGGPFTFTGTCSYIVGTRDVAIIDPGPENEAHIAALLNAVRGANVSAIVLTHTHKDHSPATRALSAATGAPIIGCAPFVPSDAAMSGLDSAHDTDYVPARVLGDGDLIEGNGFTLEAVDTPGHASNHVAFALREEKSLFSGDHVMAWSTSIVAPPDGSMSAYMASLDKLRQRNETIYWPGHGGPVNDPERYVRGLATHRRQREASILRRVTAGDTSIAAIVDRIYENLDPRLKGAAGLSVLAHLEDLVGRGVVRLDGPMSKDGAFYAA